MDLILTGIAAGVIGTMIMDFFNYLIARTGMITKIDMEILGRMAAGWTHGHFSYSHPNEMKQVANEKLYGFITHYTIGTGLAVPFLIGWHLLIGGPVSPQWAFVYGIATTIASWLFVYPSMGLGVLGMKSPESIKTPLSSLINHMFYGIGLAVAFAMI